jgi:integrase
VQLATLDKAMLRASLARLSAGRLKPATVHQVYRALRRVLGAAVENDVIARSPLEGIKPPRVEEQEMRFLTPDEVATLADAIDERYRAFVTVGAYCGLRLGEMTGLRRRRVDVLHRQMRVVEQLGRDETGRWARQPLKTRSSVRTIALPSVVAEGLDEHLHRWAGEGREGFVFAAPDGGHIDPDNFRSRIWTPAGRCRRPCAPPHSPSPTHHRLVCHRRRRGRQDAPDEARSRLCGHDPRPVRRPHAEPRRGRRQAPRCTRPIGENRADSGCGAAGRAGFSRDGA